MLNEHFEQKDIDQFFNPHNDQELETAIRTENIDVLVYYTPIEEKELIQDIPVQIYPGSGIALSSILKWLNNEGFPICNKLIYYYSKSNDVYVYCGKSIETDLIIPVQDVFTVDGKKQIYLKVRTPEKLQDISPKNVSSPLVMEQQETTEKLTSSPQKTENIPKKLTRNRQRLIGDIVNLVTEWRKMYEGYNDPKTGDIVQLTLDGAANILKVPKKSLDDYYLVIRQGKKYGFDFEKFKDSKFGVLRSFVRDKKTEKVEKSEESSADQDDDESISLSISKPRGSKKIKKEFLYN